MLRMAFGLLLAATVSAQSAQPTKPLQLPPIQPSAASLDRALQERQTRRDLTGPALSLPEAARLLWSAQGENRPGKRTVPSARARYPLELYLLTEGSPSLPAGFYRYLPREHALQKLGDRGVDALLGPLKGMQPWIAKAPAVFLFTGVPSRLGGSRQDVYTFWESGAATQALLLQATAMGLGSGVASGIDFPSLQVALALPPGEQSTVVVALGHFK